MSNIQYQISNLFPLRKFKISGHSMEPTIKFGAIVLVSPLSYFFKYPKENDIVAARIDGRIVIKRISKIEDNRFFISGDNSDDSHDSRKFGMIARKDIIGKVISIISN